MTKLLNNFLYILIYIFHHYYGKYHYYEFRGTELIAIINIR